MDDERQPESVSGDSQDEATQDADDAGVDRNWLDAIDPDAAAFVRTKGWEDLDAIVRSYQNLESMLGSERAGRTVVLPSGDDDMAAYSEIYDRLGRPAAADGYELNRDGAPVDETTLEWYRGVAYDAGLSARQATALFDAWGAMAASRVEDMNRRAAAQKIEAVEALREKWGMRFDRKIASAQRAARRFGGPHASSLQNELSHGPMVEFLARVGEALGEDGPPAGEGRNGFGLSPEEARSSYDQRKRDPEFLAALQDASHPGHAAASAERSRYLSAIWPGQ